MVKFSQISTSEMQSKWLVQKSGSEGEEKSPHHIPSHHSLGYSKMRENIVLQHKYVFFMVTYRLVIVMQGSRIRAVAHQDH